MFDFRLKINKINSEIENLRDMLNAKQLIVQGRLRRQGFANLL